ncbi:hypothetical protein TOI97_07395 [Denitrificimonas sp. JX-1]|uniref:Uncharacterized protein n=1 Tax=Denitrificimonas halotolerans TaxID=3098930 RepID=A0ABU5GT52_9GAMM|nr:hypothetical protein [Denitrificimonas sp. JX-1]MDY7219391.1 hypothetical protein [Denitrificimonas sp. JX-1]
MSSSKWSVGYNTAVAVAGTCAEMNPTEFAHTLLGFTGWPAVLHPSKQASILIASSAAIGHLLQHIA